MESSLTSGPNCLSTDPSCISTQLRGLCARRNQKKYGVASLQKKWDWERYVAMLGSIDPAGIFLSTYVFLQTIISLALILKHPAPVQPASGSEITCLSNTQSGLRTKTPNWDKDLYDQTSSDNPLRGSILSRGTLVICPVSLVGQWIEGKFISVIPFHSLFTFILTCVWIDNRGQK